MKRNQQTYNVLQLVSAVFMILALLWLTISTPFVYNCQQNKIEKEKIAAAHNATDDATEESSSTNPYGNNTEEKNPNSTSLSEEYLHHHFVHNNFSFISSRAYKCEKVDTYIAYHGELLVPPPNQA